MSKKERLCKLFGYMEVLNVQAIIISGKPGIRYFSGFTGTSGLLFITGRACRLITDFRYAEQSANEAPDFESIIVSGGKSIYDHITDFLPSGGRIGIENRNMSLYEFKKLESSFFEKKISVEFVDTNDDLTAIRAVKDDGEIRHIKDAASITDDCFKHILPMLRPGMSEIQIAFEIEIYMKKSGADSLSFETIAASGVRTCMPHAKPTSKLLELGDFVTLDFGCICDGYCSDMTRTVVVGKSNERQRNIYDIVLKAQTGALKEIRPGVLTRRVDTAARNIIKSYGYENYFGHGTGHGVGIEIHEIPRLNQSENDNIPLESGMVITDEPGIYIPDFGGVRIEDLILVTDSGYSLLSHSTKELLEIF